MTTSMTLCILQNENLFTGNGYIAKKRDTHIEIWSEDGETYLESAPLDFTREQIEVAVRFYHAGQESRKSHNT